MQKLGLQQSLQQKLSPQQIQFIKLLQIPTAELSQRIEEEMEQNPVLEEGKDEPSEDLLNATDEHDDFDANDAGEDLDVNDYLDQDDIAGYKMQGDGFDPNQEDKEAPIATSSSLTESLMTQLGFLRLDERQRKIGEQLIGSVDEDGYIRRELTSIVNDLAFMQNVETDFEEVETLLFKIQEFDPPGIAARDLRECLIIQLERKEEHTEEKKLAIQVLDQCFDEFTKKHYARIQRKLGIKDQDKLRDAINLITRLNPKPGESTLQDSARTAQYIIPDFIVTNNDGNLELKLNAKNAPQLRVNRTYAEMLDTYDKAKKKDKHVKEAANFVKQKLDSAKWFIDAIKQRQNTLLNTMSTIMEYQHAFFLEGDETRLRPMILKDIAEKVGMDISTVSRVANSKFVQTEFGVFPLKFFFSEAISTESGEDVSSREVKHELRRLIEGEDKRKPLSDDKLEALLKEKGYVIARRTVAKYREQLNIPIARLRKELV